jgi:GDP-D-mannose 3', 5'-epimerase
MVMNKTVYVTGAAGMIGSVFCREALLSGFKVVGIDNLSRGSFENLKPLEVNTSFSFVHADISCDLEWSKHINNSDIIVHLADIVGGIGYVANNEWSIFNQNLRINSHLARIVNLCQPRKLIYVGTACSYPQGMQRSVDKSGLTETDKFPADPESGYGWSKLIGDIEYALLCKSNGVTYTNLDLHNVYGSPCDFNPATAQVIPSLIYKALTSEQLVIWGNGEQGRAFVEVRDVAAAILAAIDLDMGGSYMIGPNSCTTINGVVELLLGNPKVKAKTVVKDLSQPVGDIGRYYCGSAAHRNLGWIPKISIEQGLSDLVEYIEKRI